MCFTFIRYAVVATGCAGCPKLKCERPGCGSHFCYHCKAEWHPNQTCDMARAMRSPNGLHTYSYPFTFIHDIQTSTYNNLYIHTQRFSILTTTSLSSICFRKWAQYISCLWKQAEYMLTAVLPFTTLILTCRFSSIIRCWLYRWGCESMSKMSGAYSKDGWWVL